MAEAADAGNDPKRRPPSVRGERQKDGTAVGAPLITGDGNLVSIVYSPREAGRAAGEGRLEVMRRVRIFLSSPGDVAYERQLVRDVARELVAEPYLRYRAM